MADVWLKADSAQRRLITSAAQAIDNRLAVDAKNEGESRPDGRRLFFESPLGVAFRVDAGGAEVHVLRVWRIR